MNAMLPFGIVVKHTPNKGRKLELQSGQELAFKSEVSEVASGSSASQIGLREDLMSEAAQHRRLDLSAKQASTDAESIPVSQPPNMFGNSIVRKPWLGLKREGQTKSSLAPSSRSLTSALPVGESSEQKCTTGSAAR